MIWPRPNVGNPAAYYPINTPLTSHVGYSGRMAVSHFVSGRYLALREESICGGLNGYAAKTRVDLNIPYFGHNTTQI